MPLVLPVGNPANNGISGNQTGGTPVTFNFRCPAEVDCLILGEGNISSTSLRGAIPTAVSYNGVAMTLVPGSGSNWATTTGGSSLWYLTKLLNGGPFDGLSHQVSITYADTLNGQVTTLQGFDAVNQSAPFGVAAINQATSGSPSVTAAGAGSNDIYLGVALSGATASLSPLGTGQQQLTLGTSRGSFGVSLDSIPGTNTGAFSWKAGSSGSWETAGVALFAAPAQPPVLQSRILRRRKRPRQGGLVMGLDLKEWY